MSVSCQYHAVWSTKLSVLTQPCVCDLTTFVYFTQKALASFGLFLLHMDLKDVSPRPARNAIGSLIFMEIALNISIIFPEYLCCLCWFCCSRDKEYFSIFWCLPHVFPLYNLLTQKIFTLFTILIHQYLFLILLCMNLFF